MCLRRLRRQRGPVDPGPPLSPVPARRARLALGARLMALLSRITDHVARGLLKVAMPFWGLPRFEAVLTALLEELQAAEDALIDVAEGHDVDTADETRLLVLGRIVGERRMGRALEAFRLGVKARIAINSSRGRIQHVQDLFALLRPLDTATVRMVSGGMVVQAVTDTPPTAAEGRQIGGYLQAASSIAFQTDVIWTPDVGETDDLIWGEDDATTQSRLFGQDGQQ